MARSMVRFAVPRFCLIASILLSTIGCDQVTKAVARDAIQKPLAYWSGSLVFEHAQNSGAFLNFGAAWPTPVRFWIFSVTVLAGLMAGAIWIWRQRQSSARVTLATSLILAGGAGNLIDRMVFGSVTDFMNVGIGSLRTGIFNVADMAITLGFLLLLFPSRRRARTAQRNLQGL